MGMLLAWAYPAHSATVIYDESGNAIGIDGLIVTGYGQYDVDFLYDSFNDLWPSGSNPEFWGDESGAQSASDAINSVLNDESTPPFVSNQGKAYYYVPFKEVEGNYPIQNVRSYRKVYDLGGVEWLRDSNISVKKSYPFSYAKFTAVPIPPALLLLGSGLVVIVGIRRKTGAKG